MKTAADLSPLSRSVLYFDYYVSAENKSFYTENHRALSDLSSFKIETLVLSVSHRECLPGKNAVENDRFEKFVFGYGRKKKTDASAFSAEFFDHIVSVNVIDRSVFFFQVVVKKGLKRTDGKIGFFGRNGDILLSASRKHDEYLSVFGVFRLIGGNLYIAEIPCESRGHPCGVRSENNSVYRLEIQRVVVQIDDLDERIARRVIFSLFRRESFFYLLPA